MISHKPLNCIKCVVKRLKSSEFRIKSRRRKIRKKGTCCLCSNFRSYKTMWILSSCLVTFRAIVGLVDSSVLLGVLSPYPTHFWTYGLVVPIPFFCKTTSARNLPDMALEFKSSSVPTKQLPLKQNTERVSYIITDFPHHEAPEAWIQILTPALFL